PARAQAQPLAGNQCRVLHRAPAGGAGLPAGRVHLRVRDGARRRLAGARPRTARRRPSDPPGEPLCGADAEEGGLSSPGPGPALPLRFGRDDLYVRSMTAATAPLTPQESAALTRRITLMSVATAAVLGAIKLAAWLASGSTAMLASMADSGLDLVASLGTFWAVRYAAAPPDAEHRFGHGKAEAFASLMQAGLVFASAALVGEEAIRHLIEPRPIQAEGWAMGVMVISTTLTGGLIYAQSKVLRRTGSVAVSGDRAHYAADLASNLVVFIGIGAAALTGLARIDAAAGLIVALWLV